MNGKARFGETLKKFKEAQKLTFVEFSEELGIAKSALRGYMLQERNPRLDTLELIAEKLKISLPELLGYENPARKPKIHPMVEAIYEQILQLSDSLYAQEVYLKGGKEYLPYALPEILSTSFLTEGNSEAMFLYIPYEETYYTSELGIYRSCGIAIFQGREFLMAVSDISTEAKDLIWLAKLCCKECLSPIHFCDVIEDFLSSPF